MIGSKEPAVKFDAIIALKLFEIVAGCQAESHSWIVIGKNSEETKPDLR